MKRTHEKIQYMKNIEKILDEVRQIETAIQLQAIKDHQMLAIFKYKLNASLNDKGKRNINIVLQKPKKIRFSEAQYHYIGRDGNLLRHSKKCFFQHKSKSCNNSLAYAMKPVCAGDKKPSKRSRSGEDKSDPKKSKEEHTLQGKNSETTNIPSETDTTKPSSSSKKKEKKVRKFRKKRSAVRFEDENKKRLAQGEISYIEIKIPEDRSLSLDILTPASTVEGDKPLPQRWNKKDNTVNIRGDLNQGGGFRLYSYHSIGSPTRRRTESSLSKPSRIKNISINVKSEGACLDLLHAVPASYRRRDNHNYFRKITPDAVFRRGSTTSMDSTSNERSKRSRKPNRLLWSSDTDIFQKPLSASLVSRDEVKKVDRQIQTDISRIRTARERYLRKRKLGASVIYARPPLADIDDRLTGGSNEKSSQTEPFYVDSPITSAEFKEPPKDLKYSEELTSKSVEVLPEMDSSEYLMTEEVATTTTTDDIEKYQSSWSLPRSASEAEADIRKQKHVIETVSSFSRDRVSPQLSQGVPEGRSKIGKETQYVPRESKDFIPEKDGVKIKREKQPVPKEHMDFVTAADGMKIKRERQSIPRDSMDFVTEADGMKIKRERQSIPRESMDFITKKERQSIPEESMDFIPTADGMKIKKERQSIPKESMDFIPTIDERRVKKERQSIPRESLDFITKKERQYIPKESMDFIPTADGMKIKKERQSIPKESMDFIPTIDERRIKKERQYVYRESTDIIPTRDGVQIKKEKPSSPKRSKYFIPVTDEDRIKKDKQTVDEDSLSDFPSKHIATTSKRALEGAERQSQAEVFRTPTRSPAVDIEDDSDFEPEKRTEKYGRESSVSAIGSDISEGGSLEVDPQEAIDQIKGEVWDSELLLLITPYDSDTFEESEQLQLHAIDKIYKQHLGSFCIPKKQLNTLKKSGIFGKYCAYITTKKINIEKELLPIIMHTRYLADQNCCCEITEIPDISASPRIAEIFKSIKARRVYSDEFGDLLKLAVENKFSIYARPDYHNEDNVYILDFFTQRNNYLGTVSAKYDAIIPQVKKNKEIIPRFNIILDVNELVMPSTIRKVLSYIACQLGLIYFYDCLGTFLFDVYKRFA